MGSVVLMLVVGRHNTFFAALILVEHRAEGSAKDISTIIEENQNRTAQFEQKDTFQNMRNLLTEMARIDQELLSIQKIKAENNDSRNIFSSAMKPKSFIFGTIILLVGTLPFAALIVAKRYYAKNNDDVPYQHFEDEPRADMNI